MVRLTIKSAIGVLFVAVIACKALPLSITRADNNSSLLKIQGYYYAKVRQTNQEVYETIVLYKNGIYKYLGVVFGNDFRTHDEKIRQGYSTNSLYFAKEYHWGVYVINGNNITIERWTPGPDRPIFLDKTGVILNDSTFVSRYFAVPDTYHFRYLPIKPDSVNQYIK